MDDRSVDLSRLRNGAPLLSQHNQYSLSGQIGVVDTVRVEGGKGYATVRFSRRADVEPIWQDVRDGILRNVSVGYDQDKLRDTNEERDGIPVREVTRWTPHELSLVSIPADAGAQIRTANDQAPPANEENMDPEDTNEPTRANPQTPETTAAQPSAAAIRAAAEQAVQDGIRRERERVESIHGAVSAARLTDGAELARALVSEGVSVDVARERVLERLAALDAPETGGAVQPGDGRRDAEFRAHAVAGLVYAAGGSRVEPEHHDARQIASGGLHDFMRTLLEMGGKSARGLHGGRLVRAAMETGDFVHIIADIAEKSLLDGYQAEEQDFKGIFRKATARNFKNIERVRLGDFPALASVAEGAGYTEAAIGENKEVYGVGKFGKRIGYTFEMMVDQDLDMIGRIPMQMGNAAARLENYVVWTKFMTPGNLADGNAVFNVGDENESNLVLDAAGMKVARKYFNTRTAEEGARLGLKPSFLVVGSDLLDDAEFLLGLYPETAFGDRSSLVSATLRKQLTLVHTDYVPALNWFVLASNAQIDTMEYAYLDGYERPTITREDSFAVDKIDMKVRHIFGAGWIDRRGAWHSDSTV